MQRFDILEKWTEMVDYGYIALKQFPKSEKFAICQDIRECMWNIGSHLQHACNIRNRDKKHYHAEKADFELGKLKLLVRSSMRLKFLPFQKYNIWSAMLVEIGKMLGGWKRSVS